MRKEALYILRLWHDGGNERAWRASLENLRTKHRELFASIEMLHVFLDELTAREFQPELEGRSGNVDEAE